MDQGIKRQVHVNFIGLEILIEHYLKTYKQSLRLFGRHKKADNILASVAHGA